ncbi:phage head closure protein [Stenotrophomonas sp. NPDC078853]|uniref:phage head closure protein n=1 Tax=Stenotrophomonas sp. NPDC078853 TaxID=3364534 RepID=UPI0038503DF8
MRAGELRHRPVLQVLATVQDDETGEMVARYIDVTKVWAKIEPLSAKDLIAAQASGSEVSVRVTIRHRKGITDRHRFVHRDQFLHVQGVLPDADSGRDYLTLPCSEGVKRWQTGSGST